MQTKNEMSNLMELVDGLYIWLCQVCIAIASSNEMENSFYSIINWFVSVIERKLHRKAPLDESDNCLVGVYESKSFCLRGNW